MRLADTIELYAGGPGSGCNPDVAKPRCGRPEKTLSEGKLRVRDLGDTWRLEWAGIARMSVSRLDDDVAMTGVSMVDQQYRGQGIGTALYRRAAKFARDKGFKILRSSDLLSDSTRSVWKRLGARSVGVHYELDLVPGAGRKVKSRYIGLK